MARSRRRVFGRSLALLALGIALGVGLFLARHLRPAALKLQVREALEEVFLAPFEFDDVILDLNTGIELRGLRVLYDDDLAAIEAERVALTVDHQRLLNGEVIIRQVDVDGLVVRLRPDLSGAPGLPGVLRPPAEDSSSTAAPPLIRLRSGTTGSAIELHDLNWMRGSAAIRIECQTAEGHADGPLYVVNGSFSGEHIGRLSLRLRYDEPNQTLDLAAEANDMAWTREFWQKFSPETLAMLPPVETAGSASATGSARFLLAPWRLDHCRVDGELKGLEGAFGNIHTGEREGLPFAISQGGARLSYEDGVITMRDFAADYVSPGGRVGQLKAKLDLDLTRVEPHLDLKLNARGMRVETDDLRKLLPPQVVSAVIEQFLPGGTFNFDLAISQRPALPESVSLDLRIEDGHLNYAGEFDELTGRRFGFRYPLSRCRGHLVIDTNIPTPHGWADRVVIHGIDGYNPIARPRPEGPSDVAVHAKGRVVTYATAEGEPKRDEIAIDIDAKNLPIDAKLATAFASTPDGTPYEKFDLTGWAKTVAIRVRRDAFSDDPRARATYDVELVDCAIAYEAFPLRLRKISGRILSREPPPDENGVSWRTLEMKDMHGEADGGGTFTANGLVRQDDRGTDELTLAIGAKGLVLGPELDECLDAAPIIGEELRRLWRRLDPSGTVDAELTFRSPTDPVIRIDLGGTTNFDGFKDIDLSMRGMQGSIAYEHEVVTLHGIRGKSMGATFHLGGVVKDNGAFMLDAAVSDVALDRRARALLSEFAPDQAARIEELHIAETSRLDVVLRASRTESGAPIELTTHLERLRVALDWPQLPLTIRGGPVDIDDKEIRARDISIRSGDGELHLLELAMPIDLDGDVTARLSARNIHPYDHLEALFGPGLGAILGHNLRLDLDQMEVSVDAATRLMRVQGDVDLRRNELLDERIDALEPTGHVRCAPILLRLPEKRGGPVGFSGILHFVGLNMNLPVRARDMSGELRIGTATISPEFSLKGAVFDGAATVLDRTVTDLSLNFGYDPHYLRLGNINGSFYRGILRGDIEVHLTDPSAFRVRLRAADVELGDMLRKDLPRDEPMTGTLSAAIEFESISGELDDMSGRGEVRVKEGRLFAVPGLRRFLSVLARAAPFEGPHFESAELDFLIEGESMKIEKLHFADNLNDVDARGTITIYGDLNLVVEPAVTRLLDLPRIFNLPILTTIRNLWHRTAYEIRMEGTIDSPALRLRALPFLKRKTRPFTQSAHAGRAERVRPRVLPR